MPAELQRVAMSQLAVTTPSWRLTLAAIGLRARHVVTALRLVRLPLFMTLLGVAFLSQPGQTLEFYRVLLDDLYHYQIDDQIFHLRDSEIPGLVAKAEAQGADATTASDMAWKQRRAEDASNIYPDLLHALLSRRVIGSVQLASLTSALGGVLLLAFSIRHMTRYVTLRVGELAWMPKGSWSVAAVTRFGPAVLAALPLLAFAHGVYLATPSPDRLLELQKAYAAAGGTGYEFADWNRTLIAESHLHVVISVICAAIGVLLLLMFLAFELIGLFTKTVAGGHHAEGSRRIWRGVLLAILAASGLVIVTASAERAQLIGSLAIFCVFLSILSLMAGQLNIWSERLGVPILTPLLMLAIGFSFLDLNDNHRIRRLGVGGAAIESDAAMDAREVMPDVGSEFLKWYASRADLPDYQPGGAMSGRPYPIFIAAAQGGGIYAAVHGLETLATLQVGCPAFAQHLFAISSVSGGSVGSAMFVGMTKNFAENKPIRCKDFPLRPADIAASTPETEAFNHLSEDYYNRIGAQYGVLKRIGTRDFMSPLLGAMLFPDFVQRFLPFPIPQFSRARASEAAFEDTWDTAFACDTAKDIGEVRDFISAWGRDPSKLDPAGCPKLQNPLRHGFLEAWDPASATPALVINATESFSGRRRIIAPFTFGVGLEHPNSDLRFMPLTRDNDIPLSTAASLSARFLWASPAGWFNEAYTDKDGKRQERKVRLVDGGYIDNSGIVTALDLIKSLTDAVSAHKDVFAKLPKLELHLIVTMTGDFTEEKFHGLGEGLAPIQAMLNSRIARSYAAVEQAEQLLRRNFDDPAAPLGLDCRSTGSLSSGSSSGGRVETRLHRISVEDKFYPLPLGWRLSELTWYLVQWQTGDPFSCRQDLAAQCRILASGSRPDGDCVQSSILRLLTGKSSTVQ